MTEEAKKPVDRSPIRFNSNKEKGLSKDAKALLAWWRSLSGFPGDKADLKRCDSINQIALNPMYYRLRRELGVLRANKMATAVLAGVLAHVNTNIIDTKFSVQIARPSARGGSNSAVSDQRFKRLLATKDRDDMEVEDWDELLNAVIRIVQQLDGNANIIDLASSLYWWNNQTKQRWASNYYQNVPR